MLQICFHSQPLNRRELLSTHHQVIFWIFHNKKTFLSSVWPLPFIPDFVLYLRVAAAALPWKSNPTTKHCVAFLLLVSITASLNHDYQQGSTASHSTLRKSCSDSSTKPDGEDDWARESHEEPIAQLPTSTYTQLNQLPLFILDAFITLDRSPALPSKLLILSHKVYCQCIALHFFLR